MTVALALALLPSLAMTPGCGNERSLDNLPCPCASGWTCCAEQNVCIEGTECPERPRSLLYGREAYCIATDADSVYWQGAFPSVVMTPKDGGEPQSVLLQSSSSAVPRSIKQRCGIVVDGSTIFTTASETGDIVRVKRNRAQSRLEAPPTGLAVRGLKTPSSLAADDTSLFVNEYDAGTIKKLSKDFDDSDIALTTVELASGRFHPDHVVVAQGYVYWTEGSSPDSSTPTGGIRRVKKGGGAVETVVSEMVEPTALAIVGRNLYFVTDHVLKVVDVEGLSLATLADGVASEGGSIAADADFVYYGYSDAESNSLRKVPVSGGMPKVLFAETSVPRALAIDNVNVYMTLDTVVLALKKTK